MNKQGKVWGHTSLILSKNNTSIHRIAVNPGGYCSVHKHDHKHNMFFIESGELTVRVWKNDYDLVDVTTLEAGDSVSIAPGEYHQFENTSGFEAIVYEIYWTELDEGDISRKSVGGLNEIEFGGGEIYI